MTKCRLRWTRNAASSNGNNNGRRAVLAANQMGAGCLDERMCARNGRAGMNTIERRHRRRRAKSACAIVGICIVARCLRPATTTEQSDAATHAARQTRHAETTTRRAATETDKEQRTKNARDRRDKRRRQQTAKQKRGVLRARCAASALNGGFAQTTEAMEGDADSSLAQERGVVAWLVTRIQQQHRRAPQGKAPRKKTTGKEEIDWRGCAFCDG